MEPAVSVKLAGVLGQVTSLDDLEDVNFRLQGEGQDRFVACPVPHSRRNSGSRRPANVKFYLDSGWSSLRRLWRRP